MDLRASTVAVTGVTGCLGRYIALALVERGARVIGVARRPERVPSLAEQGIELRRADLAERQSLAASFEGVHAVVSNAALVSLYPRRWGAYLRTNVEGTRNVYEAMASRGVRRAIQISSVGVYRGRNPDADEDYPQREVNDRGRIFNGYNLSKKLSELAARDSAETHGIDLTILRPSAIYGAFDPSFTAMHKLLVSHLPVALYPCLMRICLVYAGDVAEAAALALEQPRSCGRAYNVTGEDETVWSFGREWIRAGGPSARFRIPIPVPYRRRYSSARVRRELGWRARPHGEGIRDLLEREAADPPAP